MPYILVGTFSRLHEMPNYFQFWSRLLIIIIIICHDFYSNSQLSLAIFRTLLLKQFFLRTQIIYALKPNVPIEVKLIYYSKMSNRQH